MSARVAALLTVIGGGLLLQGCVAAVIPAIAASTMARRQMGHPKRPAEERRAMLTSGGRGLAGATSATLLPLTALPPPSTAPDPTMRFVNHALMLAASGATPAQSMVLSGTSTLDQPAFLPCDKGQPLAVAIDAQLATAPGLAEGLRRLRSFQVEVLWVADAGQVDALRAALRANGAWKNGDAPILTTGVGAERKELVRREATRAFCVVAVAGAKRGDVEELYDFLREPGSALELEHLWGAGWFVLPATGMGQP